MSAPNFWNVPPEPWNVYTGIWLLVGGVIGVVFNRFIQYIFEEYIPTRQYEKASRVSIQKYQLPLLLYGRAAEKSLLGVVKGIDKNDNEDSHLRILYFICAFLGWCQIVSKRSLVQFAEHGFISSKSLKPFGNHYNKIVSGISSLEYFSGIEDKFEGTMDSTRVPSLVATAIGDLMTEREENIHGIYQEIISYRAFVNDYKNSHEVREWLAYLENILHYESRSKRNIKWNRLILFYAHIHIFCDYIDTRSKSKVTAAFAPVKNAILGFNRRDTILDEIYESMHPKVQERLLVELDEMKYRIVPGIDKKMINDYYSRRVVRLVEGNKVSQL
jgi:hypothetical protein